MKNRKASQRRFNDLFDDVKLHGPSDRKNSYSGFRFVNHNESTRGQVGFVLFQSCNHNRCHVIGEHILASDLDDARPRRMRQSKHRPKVQVMRENDVIV